MKQIIEATEQAKKIQRKRELERMSIMHAERTTKVMLFIFVVYVASHIAHMVLTSGMEAF